MDRCILHCDMNNFYASVECMLDMSLRGHPVAVGGDVENRHGIILAKNYEAKKYGVSTGEALWQARTIDKSRLEDYIGKLNERTIQRIDKSLGVSVGLSHKIDWSKGIELCLCGRCASDFYNVPGHYIKRVDKDQTVKETCTYCNSRLGYDYIIVQEYT